MGLCVCEAPKGAVPRQQFFLAETRRSRVEACKKCSRGTAPFGAEHTHRRMHYTQKVWLVNLFLCLPHCLSFQYEVNTYFFILFSRLRWMRPNWCSVHTWIKLVLCKSTLRAFVSPPPLSFFPLRAFSFCRRKRAKRLLRHFGGEELVDGRAKKIKKFREVTSSTRTWTSLATVAAPKTSTRSAKERKFPLLPSKIHVPLAALPSSSLQDTCVLLQCLIFEFGGLYIKALFIPLSVVTPITKKTFLVTGKSQLTLKKSTTNTINFYSDCNAMK